MVKSSVTVVKPVGISVHFSSLQEVMVTQLILVVTVVRRSSAKEVLVVMVRIGSEAEKV